MTLCLFIGSTLPQRECAGLGDALILPPAAQGDVWRAAQSQPRAIGIVDGYFSGAPSVWHKEILWALSRGIHVFGSASMGALRAAELHAYGMRGVGRIFEAFRDGHLEDDDEVAVSHGPAELGYPALSEAMVNIRATLACAESEGVLKLSDRQKLEARAKAFYFPDRSWAALLDGVTGVSPASLEALREWLPRGRVDQKREDAIEMIRVMQENLEGDKPPQVSFHFEWTHFWDEMIVRTHADHPRTDSDSAVLDELRLENPDAYKHARTRALARLLSGQWAAHLVIGVSQEAMRETLSRLRAERGLFTRAALDAWMAENGLDTAAMERLVEDEARLAAVSARFRIALDAAMADELRLSGAWPQLARRAGEKAAAVSAHGSAPSDAMALRQWYFQHRLGRPVPDNLANFINELGFETLAEFDRALHTEILYVNSDRDPDR